MSEVSLVDGHIDNGMSDEDIIKALECCKEAKLNQDCLDLECPFATEYGCNIDVEELRNAALDLINRQKAEIDRLQRDIASQKDLIESMYIGQKGLVDYAKSNAIKEFVERLKSKMIITHKSKEGYCVYEFDDELIDNLVKEMTESK